MKLINKSKGILLYNDKSTNCITALYSKLDLFWPPTQNIERNHVKELNHIPANPPPALLSPGYQHSKEDMEHSPRSVLYAQGLCVENNMLVDYAISKLEAVPQKCSMPKGSSLPHHSVLRVPVQGLKLNNPATEVNLYFLLRIEQYIFLVNRKIVISSNIPSEARM